MTFRNCILTLLILNCWSPALAGDSDSWDWEPEPPAEKSFSLGAGVSIGPPERFSARLIAIRGAEDETPHAAGPGLMLIAEPGVSAGRLGLGYGVLTVSGPFYGQISLMRTWGNPLDTGPDLTYVGIELHVLAFRVSVFNDLSGSQDDGRLVTAGISFSYIFRD